MNSSSTHFACSALCSRHGAGVDNVLQISPVANVVAGITACLLHLSKHQGVCAKLTEVLLLKRVAELPYQA